MALRRLVSATTICVLAGLAGGLLLGVILSHGSGWLTPAPWAVYLTVLLVAIAAITWLDERRRLHLAEAAWPLPPGYGIPEHDQSPQPEVLETPSTEDAACATAEGVAGESAAREPVMTAEQPALRAHDDRSDLSLGLVEEEC